MTGNGERRSGNLAGGRFRRFSAICVLLAVTAAACDGGDRESGPEHQASPMSVPTKRLVPVPDFGPGYKTTGEYVQVSGPAGLERVNDALRQLVFDDLSRLRSVASPAPLAAGEYPGEYALGGSRADTAVNASVVSVMIPATFALPEGKPGGYWLALTVRVPSGEPINIADLLSNPASGLSELGRLTMEQIRKDPCVGPDIDTFSVAAEWDTAETYRAFAVTKDGLALGFRQGNLGMEACGPLRVLIRWERLEALLTTEARTLVRYVRGDVSAQPVVR